ncbi:MAG: UbiX family flavin prenyltransferase [Rikenellaceae bacterium]
MRIIVAVTGASGAIYCRQLIQLLEKQEEVTEIALVFSKNGRDVMLFEEGLDWMANCTKVKFYENNDFFTPVASGSAYYDAMVVVPSSVGTMSRIANGISGSLIERSADVMIKERRKLIVVIRETPLSLIHIRNLETLTLSGAIILPAVVSYYSKPQCIEDLAMSVTSRIMMQLGFQISKGWKED